MKTYHCVDCYFRALFEAFAKRVAAPEGLPEMQTLECDHCGDVAIESRTGFSDGDGEGIGCASCGFPGMVSCDAEDGPWWRESHHPLARCTRKDCEECRPVARCADCNSDQVDERGNCYSRLAHANDGATGEPKPAQPPATARVTTAQPTPSMVGTRELRERWCSLVAAQTLRGWNELQADEFRRSLMAGEDLVADFVLSEKRAAVEAATGPLRAELATAKRERDEIRVLFSGTDHPQRLVDADDEIERLSAELAATAQMRERLASLESGLILASGRADVNQKAAKELRELRALASISEATRSDADDNRMRELLTKAGG